MRQRIFNSTAPFSGSPQAELKGSYSACSTTDQEIEEEEEEGKDKIIDYPPHINKIITHGTAEHIGEAPLKTSTIIAQAECNYAL